MLVSGHSFHPVSTVLYIFPCIKRYIKTTTKLDPVGIMGDLLNDLCRLMNVVWSVTMVTMCMLPDPGGDDVDGVVH